MIDFDHPDTFPQKIKNWVSENKNYFAKLLQSESEIDVSDVVKLLKEKCQSESFILKFIHEYIMENKESEFIVHHATRIQKETDFTQSGIVPVAKDHIQFDQRIKSLLKSIGVNADKISLIMNNVSYYLDRDQYTRVDTVHYFLSKEQIKDGSINVYALNLGGEILRWSIAMLDRNLYQKDPYKKLWIMGTPCMITFKIKLMDMDPMCQIRVISEMMIYYAIADHLKVPYRIRGIGFKSEAVNAADILRIERIDDFVAMQEEFEEYQCFY